MSRVGGKIRVGRVTPIQQFFFFGLSAKFYFAEEYGKQNLGTHAYKKSTISSVSPAFELRK